MEPRRWPWDSPGPWRALLTPVDEGGDRGADGFERQSSSYPNEAPAVITERVRATFEE